MLLIGSLCGMAKANPERMEYPLVSVDGIEQMNVKAEQVTYRGQDGIRLVKDIKEDAGKNPKLLAIISDTDFQNGTIEVELAGHPAPGAPKNARGFVGIAFRVQTESDYGYECFYLRPLNGRAEKQLMRNHSVQYMSDPDYHWKRLREETPGVYESYVDLATGEWTKVKITVSGEEARLYVHGAEQPSLIVKDLKRDESRGKIALWTAHTTVAHFRNLVVTAN